MTSRPRDAAYDISLFENSSVVSKPSSEKQKRKRNNVVSIPEEKLEKVRRHKYSKFKLVTGFATGLAVTIVVAAIIQGQVQLTELNSKISSAETKLAEQQSAYTQVKMRVEGNLSPADVEAYAKSTLGMVKADAYQKNYISLSEGDKAEVTESDSGNVFESIANAIGGLWS